MSTAGTPAPAPYRAATPVAVAAFMAALCDLTDQTVGANAYFGQLVQLVCIPRAPAAQGPAR